jgi:hypothetical protein
MSLTSFTVRANQNDQARGAIGDLTITIYDVEITTAGANAYPAGGEPLDLSGEFAEVHSVNPVGAINPAGAGAADATGAMLPVFERAAGSDNTGFLRLSRSGGVGANLAELAAGAYPNNMQFSILVVGRPSTDAA